MGVSRTPEQFASKIVAAGNAFQGSNRAGVTAASAAAKEVIENTARGDTGGDLKLSRWRSGKGIKISAGYEVRTTNPGLSIGVVKPRPIGVWKLLEDGAKAHPIVPGLTRRQQRAAVLFTFMAGGRGSIDAGDLSSIQRGNRNNVNSRRRRRRRAGALTIGPNFRPYANHPGSKGRNTWTNGAKAAKPVATAAYQRSQRDTLKRAFR